MPSWTCGRCGKESSYQGHYFRICHVINRIENRQGIDAMLDHPFHMCCPGDCDVYEQDGTPKPVGSRWTDEVPDDEVIDGHLVESVLSENNGGDN